MTGSREEDEIRLVMTEASTGPEKDREPQCDSSAATTRIERPSLELASVRVQLAVGLLLSLSLFALALGRFWTIPFSLPDYHTLGSSIFINPSASVHDSQVGMHADLLGLEEIFFGTRSWLYRLFNSGLIVSAALFLCLAALDMTNRYGKKVGAAVALWTFLLFLPSVFNVLALLDIAGTGVLASCALALAALFFDGRFRLLGEKWYYWLALVCLALAAAADAGGLVLGASGIILHRFSLPGGRSAGRCWQNGPAGAVPYLVAAGLAAVALFPSLREFRLASLAALLVPPSGGKLFFRLLCGLQIAVVVMAGLRVLAGRTWLRPLLFCLLWAALCLGCAALLDWPSAHLAALTGAPLAMLTAFCALPGNDALSRRTGLILTVAGSVLLSGIFIARSAVSLSRLGSCKKAALELRNVQKSLHLLLGKSERPLAVYVEPLWEASCSSFLSRRQPLADSARGEDLWRAASGMLAVTDPGITARVPVEVSVRDGAVVIGRTLSSGGPLSTFRCSPEGGYFVPVRYRGATEYSWSCDETSLPALSTTPSSISSLYPRRWSYLAGSAFLEIEEDEVGLIPGPVDALILWLPPCRLNPCRIGAVRVRLGRTAGRMCTEAELVFRSEPPGVIAAAVPMRQEGRGSQWLSADTAGCPQWKQADAIVQIGVRCPPGEHRLSLREVRTASAGGS